MAEEFEDTRMTLGEHIAELRTRLLKGLVVVVVAFGLAWSQYDLIAQLVMEPYHEAVPKINEHYREYFAGRVQAGLVDAGDYFDVEPGEGAEQYFANTDPELWKLNDRWSAPDRLSVISMTEQFTFILQICLYFAVFIGGPFLIWQLWQFIAAGLYETERKAAMRYFPYSVALFLVGVAFGYFIMVPYAMYFLATAFESDMIEPQYRLKDYFSLLTSLCLALAAVFQLPVIMVFSTRLGLVEPAKLASFRSYFIVGAFIVAAILTPPDPITQTMMAVPMVVLYELGLLAARFLAKPRASQSTDLEVAS